MSQRSKMCTMCREIVALVDFPPDKRAPDGKQARCRKCVNTWIKNHYWKYPVEAMLRRAKVRAKRVGLEFNLSPEDISPLPKFCPVFGVELRLGAQPQDPNAYSLDRINNSQGYVKGNVAVMSYRANRLKNDGSAADHETIARWMRSNLSEPSE